MLVSAADIFRSRLRTGRVRIGTGWCGFHQSSAHAAGDALLRFLQSRPSRRALFVWNTNNDTLKIPNAAALDLLYAKRRVIDNLSRRLLVQRKQGVRTGRVRSFALPRLASVHTHLDALAVVPVVCDGREHVGCQNLQHDEAAGQLTEPHGMCWQTPWWMRTRALGSEVLAECGLSRFPVSPPDIVSPCNRRECVWSSRPPGASQTIADAYARFEGVMVLLRPCAQQRKCPCHLHDSLSPTWGQQGGLRTGKGLPKQLEDHVAFHWDNDLPPNDALLELRPPPDQHVLLPPWPPACRFGAKCKFKLRCRDGHALPRTACWGRDVA